MWYTIPNISPQLSTPSCLIALLTASKVSKRSMLETNEGSPQFETESLAYIFESSLSMALGGSLN